MAQRIVRIAAFLGLVLGAVGAYAWYHVKHEAARPTFAAETAIRPETIPTGAGNSEPEMRPAAPNAGPAPTVSVDPQKSAESPVRAGEVLEYSANVSKLNNVAILRLQVGDRRDFLGKSVWHLQAFAHTENPLRMMFALDDQFDSYSDAASLASVQYEMHLNERGQQVDSVQRMTVTGKEVAPAEVTETRVLAGTRDPLGLLQYLRSVDWKKTPEVRSPVYDGHKLYDVRAREESASEAVSVPAGDFQASKINIRVLDNGVEMKDAVFSLYLANNTARTPVLIEAVIPVATARVELVKAGVR
jgi:hypothetical protein